jgi:hypothetical protein
MDKIILFFPNLMDLDMDIFGIYVTMLTEATPSE